MPETDADFNGEALEVGAFAHNIESGWLGRIAAFEMQDDLVMARMDGVDTLAWYGGFAGLADAVASNDTQWHHVKDLAKLCGPIPPKETP